MKEELRLKIIGEIKRDIEDKKSLKNKYKMLKKMSENPDVKEYLNLLSDINSIEQTIRETYKTDLSGQNIDDSLERRIELAFNSIYFRPDIKKDFHCNHDLWIYAGSDYEYVNSITHEEEHIIYGNEYLKNIRWENISLANITFSNNIYVCLECGKKIKVQDWKSFEKCHDVLKISSEEYLEYSVSDYRNLYIQLLFKYKDAIAKKRIVKKFNEEREKILVKK